MEQIAPQIYRWTVPHPEWRSSVEEVVSYALVDGEALALVDPLLPSQDDARRAPLLADLDEMIGEARRLELLVTIPYHTHAAPRRCTSATPAPCRPSSGGTPASRSGSPAWRRSR